MSIARSFRRAALALAAICLAAPDAGAQELRTGDRIRIKTVSGAPSQVTGIYQASEAESLVIYVDQSVQARVPWADVSRLQLSRGMHNNAGTGALIGVAIGGGLGLALGIAAAADDDGWFEYGAGEVALLVGITAGLGAGVGALIGMASKSERWQTIPRQQWQIQVAPDPRGGVAIGLNRRI